MTRRNEKNRHKRKEKRHEKKAKKRLAPSLINGSVSASPSPEEEPEEDEDDVIIVQEMSSGAAAPAAHENENDGGERRYPEASQKGGEHSSLSSQDHLLPTLPDGEEDIVRERMPQRNLTIEPRRSLPPPHKEVIFREDGASAENITTAATTKCPVCKRGRDRIHFEVIDTSGKVKRRRILLSPCNNADYFKVEYLS